MATLKEKVSERIANSSDVVRDKVVDLLVQDEITKRVDAVTKVMTKIDTVEAELKKEDKPNVRTVNADGSVARTEYTVEQYEKLKKLRDTLEKLKSSLDLAFDKNDFTKVLEFSK